MRKKKGEVEKFTIDEAFRTPASLARYDRFWIAQSD
jgi:hypothetical protein